MPYTSPISRSPSSSVTPSPCSSRRSSVLGSVTSPRSDLPRSTSYLSHHRRSSSLKSLTPNTPNEPHQEGQLSEGYAYTSTSLRPSPSPITKNQSIPNGAVMSPPESTHNSSDDESPPATSHHHNRVFQLKVTDTSIKKRTKDSVNEINSNLFSNNEADIGSGKCHSNNTEVPTSPKNMAKKPPGKLLLQSPIITDSQSLLTCKKIYSDNPNCASALLSDEECASEDSDASATESKPYMVRKKSGELVRPALRTPLARRRPSSVPGTPTYSKAVHFDSHLEHIRHFLQVDRPLAVSAGSSPVPCYENEEKFPFEDESLQEISYEWEFILTNFPVETPLRLAQMVRVERIFLSYDNKLLVGSVVVRNLAFNKYVVARFTLDYWKTTSEVVAEFNHDVRQPTPDGYDRFNFSIKLSDQANLESKTMFFCVKYCVNGKEYWDNNNATNFQVDFRKKYKTTTSNSKSWSTMGTRETSSCPTSKVNILPRSNARSPSHRPKSMSFIDDYRDSFDEKCRFDSLKPMFDDYFGDMGTGALPWSDDEKSGIQKNETAAEVQQRSNGNTLSYRYNFGASLSAAINAQNLPIRQRGTALKPNQDFSDDLSGSVSPRSERAVGIVNEITVPEDQNPKPSMSSSSSSSSSNSLSKPNLSSESYNDLLDKYCFFGSTKHLNQRKELSDRSPTKNSTSLCSDYHRGHKDGMVLNRSLQDEIQSSRSTPDNDSRRSRSPSPNVISNYGLGMCPLYQNFHDGHHFFEAHTATAIRGQ